MTAEVDNGEAAGLVQECQRLGLRLAVAESLTGGLLAAAIVDVPGASTVFRGGVVAYALDVKAAVLGVSRQLLEERGAVDGDVAAQMCSGVMRLLGADIAIATTGVAGPSRDGEHPVGEVYTAIAIAAQGDAARVTVRQLQLGGNRAAIRSQVVRICLSDALGILKSVTD